MTTHERLDAAREAYEQAGANTPIWVLNWTEETEALIAALEAALAAQVERTATVEAALKPFAETWTMWFADTMYNGETVGAFTEWLYDASVYKVERDYKDAYEMMEDADHD